MQDICALLTGEDLCWIALWYANIFGVAVFNASMLDWTGRSICLLYICIVLDLAGGVVVCKASMLKWQGGHLSSIYMHCPRSSSGCSGMQVIYAWLNEEGHMKCNGIQCIYAWLTGRSICLLYICIVLDLAVGVVVCKASMLKWQGGHLSSIYMHCPRSSSGCSGMQVIYARMTGWPYGLYIYALS